MFFSFQNRSSVKCTVHYHCHIVYYRIIPLWLTLIHSILFNVKYVHIIITISMLECKVWECDLCKRDGWMLFFYCILIYMPIWAQWFGLIKFCSILFYSILFYTPYTVMLLHIKFTMEKLKSSLFVLKFSF